eukprot:3501-Pleurochrysis_carterae.AAC.1
MQRALEVTTVTRQASVWTMVRKRKLFGTTNRPVTSGRADTRLQRQKPRLSRISQCASGHELNHTNKLH